MVGSLAAAGAGSRMGTLAVAGTGSRAGTLAATGADSGVSSLAAAGAGSSVGSLASTDAGPSVGSLVALPGAGSRARLASDLALNAPNGLIRFLFELHSVDLPEEKCSRPHPTMMSGGGLYARRAQRRI
jgi:hypothetical protein